MYDGQPTVSVGNEQSAEPGGQLFLAGVGSHDFYFGDEAAVAG